MTRPLSQQQADRLVGGSGVGARSQRPGTHLVPLQGNAWARVYAFPLGQGVGLTIAAHGRYLPTDRTDEVNSLVSRYLDTSGDAVGSAGYHWRGSTAVVQPIRPEDVGPFLRAYFRLLRTQGQPDAPFPPLVRGWP